MIRWSQGCEQRKSLHGSRENIINNADFKSERSTADDHFKDFVKSAAQADRDGGWAGWAEGFLPLASSGTTGPAETITAGINGADDME